MIRITTHTEAGGHAENEDAFDVHEFDDAMLCVLADGQGGQSGGGRAAKLACDKVMELSSKLPADHLKHFELMAHASLRNHLENVDSAVAGDKSAGYTTLIALAIADHKLSGASNGDSKALLHRSRGVFEELTARQEKNPPIGSGYAACVGFESWLTPPWQMLVMSDGVWKYVGHEQLREVVQRESGQALVNQLLQGARMRESGQLQDDFTLIVLEENE